MNKQISESNSLPFKDRKGWLIFFGVSLIIGGAFLLLGGVGLAVTLAFAPNANAMGAGAMNPQMMMALGVSQFFVMGIALLALGIGTVKCRRWARTLTLLFSWFILVMGV